MAQLEQSSRGRQQIEELSALDTQWPSGRITGRHESTGRPRPAPCSKHARLRIADVRYQRRVDSAGTVRCAVIAATGRSEPDWPRVMQVARARVALLPDLPVSTPGSGVVPLRVRRPRVSLGARTITTAGRRSDSKRVHAGSAATGRVAMSDHGKKFNAGPFCILPFACCIARGRVQSGSGEKRCTGSGSRADWIRERRACCEGHASSWERSSPAS